MQEKRNALKAAFPYTIPVMMGYLFIGTAFGILLNNKGYHFGWAILMSVCIYAGSMQFVAVNLLTGGVNLIQVIFMTLMVNIRHVFYGLSMLDKFKDMEKQKPYMIFSLTDETFSLLFSTRVPEGINKNWFLFFIALLNQIYWIIGSAIGGIVGSLITFDTKGIDFAMTALFVVIFVEQWQSNKNHMPALIGLIGSGLCLLIFGPDQFILPSMILMIVVLMGSKRYIEQEGEH